MDAPKGRSVGRVLPGPFGEEQGVNLENDRVETQKRDDKRRKPLVWIMRVKRKYG